MNSSPSRCEIKMLSIGNSVLFPNHIPLYFYAIARYRSFFRQRNTILALIWISVQIKCYAATVYNMDDIMDCKFNACNSFNYLYALYLHDGNCQVCGYILMYALEVICVWDTYTKEKEC